MDNITIPPEVIEAALEAFALASGLGIFPDDEKDEEWREDLQNGMRAACLAMLKAWPGAIHNGHWLLFPHTKLPLPQENTNAEG